MSILEKLRASKSALEESLMWRRVDLKQIKIRLSNVLTSYPERLKNLWRRMCDTLPLELTFLILLMGCSIILITMIIFILSLCSVLLQQVDYLLETRTFKTCREGLRSLSEKSSKAVGRVVKYLKGITGN